MLKYSSILPKVNFESLTIENKDSNNVNLNFYFSWESNLTDKWFSDQNYLNTLYTTVEVKTELSSSDSFESLTEFVRANFSDKYSDFNSNKNEFLLEGKVLEKTVDGKRKYVFPFSCTVTTDIVQFNNLQINLVSTIDISEFLRSKEVPENIISNVYSDFQNSLEFDNTTTINLITNGNMQQSVGVINDFRIIESLDKYDVLVMEQGRLDNFQNSINSIEYKQILFSLNESIDDLKIFSDLLINQTLDDSLRIYLYFNYDNAIQKLSPLLNLTGPTNLNIKVYKHNLTNDNKIVENSKVLVQDTILNNSFLDINNLNTKFLFFNDIESKLNKNQKFVYELELTLQDLTINEVYNNTTKTGLYFDLQRILNILKSYLTDASIPITTFKQVTTGDNPHILTKIFKTPTGFSVRSTIPNKIGYYNSTLNQLDVSFVEYAKTTYDIDNLIISLNDILKKLIKVIYPLETDEINRIVIYVTTLLFPNIATPNTISNTINFIEKLSLKVENIFSKIKSNVSVYNKIFIDQPILLSNTNNTYFSFTPTNQGSYSKQELLQLIKNDNFSSSDLLYFTPSNSKVLNVTYRSGSYDNLIYSDDVFIESNVFPINKLLTYYRVLDLENKSALDAEDFIDNLRTTNVPKDLAFSNNCTSTSNKLLIRSETQQNREQLPTRDEFTLNKYQLNITQPQEPTINNSRNVLSIKQNFNNLFEQQENNRISTPSTFVENPNAIKAENELLFYLFVFAPNNANTNPYRYVPIAKIQYLDVSESSVSNYVWKDLTNEVLNSNLSMAQKFCKFELVGTFDYGTSTFQSIPLLSNNINNLLVKNKYFYLEQSIQSASPTAPQPSLNNVSQNNTGPFNFSPTFRSRLQSRAGRVQSITERPFQFTNENINEREQQIKIESQPFVETQQISEKPRTVIITNNKTRVKQ